MVKQTLNDLRVYSRNFNIVKQAADTFVQYTNTKLNEVEDNTLEINSYLPLCRAKKINKTIY